MVQDKAVDGSLMPRAALVSELDHSQTLSSCALLRFSRTPYSDGAVSAGAHDQLALVTGGEASLQNLVCVATQAAHELPTDSVEEPN